MRSSPTMPPARSMVTGRHLMLVLLVAAAILVGNAVGMAGTREFGMEKLLAAMLGVSIIMPVVVRLWTRRFDPFEPVVTITGVYLIYFIAGPLLRLLTGDVMLIGRNVQPLYARGFAAVTVAVLSLWLGYHLPIGGALGRWIGAPRSGPGWSNAALKRLQWIGWGLTVAAVLALLLWSRLEGQSFARFFLPGVLTTAEEGGSGGTNLAYLFLAIEWFIPAFLILSIGRGFPAPPVRWAYFVFVSIAYTSLGFRYRLIIFWVSTFVLAYLRRNKRPGASTLLAGGAAVLLFAGWLGIARAVFKTGAKRQVASPTFVEIARNSLSDTEVFETFATVLDAVPSRVEFAGVEPYVYVFVQPIPRAIWPEKPLPTFLNKIAQAVGTPAAEEAGAAVPHFGEYYLAFGWPGLVLGTALFGVLCQMLWGWYQADRHDPWRQVIFAASNAFLVQAIIRGYSPQIVQEWFFIIFPAVAGMYLAAGADGDGRSALPYLGGAYDAPPAPASRPIAASRSAR